MRQKLDIMGRALADLARKRLSYVNYGKRIYCLLPDDLRRRFWVIMLFSLIHAVAESSVIFVIAMFARSVSSPDSLRAGRLYRWVSGFMPESLIEMLKDDRTLIIVMCCLVVLFIAGKNLLACITMALTSAFSDQMNMFLTKEAYTRYLHREYLWHFSPTSRDTITRMEWRRTLVSLFTQLINIVSGITRALVMFAVLLVMDFWITLSLIAVFSVVSGVIYAVLRESLEKHGKKVAEIDARHSWAVRLTGSGIREIIIYRKQDAFLHRILETIQEAMPHRAFLAISGRMPAWILETIGFLTILGTMVFLLLSGRPMPMIVATMSLLLLTAWRALPLVSGIMSTAVQIRGIRAKAVSCLELMEALIPENSHSTEQQDARLNDIASVELRNATFRYPQSKTDTLHGITLSITKGEQIGVIGKSGSGKTTLALMLVGLFHPSKGEMAINGHPADIPTLASYRRRVGFVPQNPLLLSGTILENVAFSDWGGNQDVSRAEAACAMAAMDYLAPGKKTLKTVIGDGGGGLSGGEAQRLSIARALYTNPEIIVFDEATSALDQESEGKINAAIASLQGKVTCVIIAHRLSTVERCDKIIWMEAGRVKKIGAPQEILKEYAPPKK